MLRNILTRASIIPKLSSTLSFTCQERLSEAARLNAPENLVYEMRNKKKQLALRKHRRRAGKSVSLRW